MPGFNTPRVWFVVIFLTYAFSGKALSAQEAQRLVAPADYRIATGEVLQIEVWKQPGITRTIPVRSDGSISLPAVNDVKVLGLSAMELVGLLRDKLKDIIPSPQVTVTVIPHGTKSLSTPPLLHPRKSPRRFHLNSKRNVVLCG